MTYLKRRNDLTDPAHRRCIEVDNLYLYYLSTIGGGAFASYYISVIDFVADNAETQIGTLGPIGGLDCEARKIEKLSDRDMVLCGYEILAGGAPRIENCTWKNIFGVPSRNDIACYNCAYNGLACYNSSRVYIYRAESDIAGVQHGRFIVRDDRGLNPPGGFAEMDEDPGTTFGSAQDVACSPRYVHVVDIKSGGVAPIGWYGVYDLDDWGGAWADFEVGYGSNVAHKRSGIIYAKKNKKFVSWGYDNRRIYVVDPDEAAYPTTYWETDVGEGNVQDVREYRGYLYIATTTNGKILCYDINGNKISEYSTGLASPVLAVGVGKNYVVGSCNGWIYLWRNEEISIGGRMKLPPSRPIEFGGGMSL